MTYAEKLKDPRWQKKRLEVFERDEWACQVCGEKSLTLNVHHLLYNKEPWETPIDSLITMCKNCHLNEEVELTNYKRTIFNQLRKNGFTSMSFSNISRVFEKDRGWAYFDPSFDILKMVVDDDELWNKMYDLFFERLNNKTK